MMRWVAAVALAVGSWGCSSSPTPPVRTPADANFFTPASMHLSPVFTKIADFDGDGQPDGVEAVVELQDRFGDPVKAAGRILFQVYDYRPVNPDPRGDRVAGPFEGRVDSVQDQRNRWSRVSRAYIFQLAFPNPKLDNNYVLEAQFESTNGSRLFDVLTLEGEKKQPGPASGPAPIGGPATSPASATGPSAANGAIVTQESLRVPTASQPHEPPARADQP